MLTIQNYSKLCRKPIGKLGWMIAYVYEKQDFYEIMLVHSLYPSTKVHLQRTKSQVGGMVVYHFVRPDGTVTRQGVTIDYIKNIKNFVKAVSNLLPS